MPLEWLEIEAVRKMEEKNLFEYREKKRVKQMTMIKLTKRPVIDLENSLSKILEDDNESV